MANVNFVESTYVKCGILVVHFIRYITSSVLLMIYSFLAKMFHMDFLRGRILLLNIA